MNYETFKARFDSKKRTRDKDDYALLRLPKMLAEGDVENFLPSLMHVQENLKGYAAQSVYAQSLKFVSEDNLEKSIIPVLDAFNDNPHKFGFAVPLTALARLVPSVDKNADILSQYILKHPSLKHLKKNLKMHFSVETIDILLTRNSIPLKDLCDIAFHSDNMAIILGVIIRRYADNEEKMNLVLSEAKNHNSPEVNSEILRSLRYQYSYYGKEVTKTSLLTILERMKWGEVSLPQQKFAAQELLLCGIEPKELLSFLPEHDRFVMCLNAQSPLAFEAVPPSAQIFSSNNLAVLAEKCLSLPSNGYAKSKQGRENMALFRKNLIACPTLPERFSAAVVTAMKQSPYNYSVEALLNLSPLLSHDQKKNVIETLFLYAENSYVPYKKSITGLADLLPSEMLSDLHEPSSLDAKQWWTAYKAKRVRKALKATLPTTKTKSNIVPVKKRLM